MISIPSWLGLLLLIAFIVALIAMWASLTANRLNRLHIRTDNARIKLEGALHARALAIAAVEPALAGEVAEVNRVALRAIDMSAHSDAENHLLAKLEAKVVGNQAFIEASARVDLAARFYNDAVADTLQVRNRWAIRVFRLAGFAPLPEYYEAASTRHV